MSTTTAPTEVTCEFDNCQETGEKWEFVGEYCSDECKQRDTGRSVLDLLKFDHRFCGACFSRLKTISRPTDEQLRHVQGRHSADSIIGFQYRTPKADTGELTITARDDRKEVVGTGIVCGSCGTTDHRDDYQRDFQPTEAAKRLRERVVETREEGQHGYEFVTSRFVEAWNESKDWELALGKALHNA